MSFKYLRVDDLRKEAIGKRATFEDRIKEQDMLLDTCDNPRYLIVSSTAAMSNTTEFDPETNFPVHFMDMEKLEEIESRFPGRKLVYIRVVLHEGKWKRVMS